MDEATIFHTEKKFRDWFEKNLNIVGVKRIILSQEVCPDYVVEMENGDIAKIEAELFAINFKYHKHNPSKADYILACFSKEEKVEGVPVIAINKLWYYEPKPTEPLPSEGPLSEDELKMLNIIKFSGSIEITALCDGYFYGNRNLYMRISPKYIASFPRGKIEDNIGNIVSPQAKKYIKKYHHALIGTNLSEKACDTIELLNRRRLIKARPISFISAAYDGVMIKHDGWIPTELYLTSTVDKFHKKALLDYHLKTIEKLRSQ